MKTWKGCLHAFVPSLTCAQRTDSSPASKKKKTWKGCDPLMAPNKTPSCKKTHRTMDMWWCEATSTLGPVISFFQTLLQQCDDNKNHACRDPTKQKTLKRHLAAAPWQCKLPNSKAENCYSSGTLQRHPAAPPTEFQSTNTTFTPTPSWKKNKACTTSRAPDLFSPSFWFCITTCATIDCLMHGLAVQLHLQVKIQRHPNYGSRFWRFFTVTIFFCSGGSTLQDLYGSSERTRCIGHHVCKWIALIISD